MNKLKSQICYFYEQFYMFLKYIVTHPLSALLLLAGVLISYGSYAFATDYYVDSEVVINIPGTNYNWLEIGRYGLVFTRKLLGTSWYNPYYTGILMLFFLWLTGMTFSYISGKLFPKLPVSLTILGSLIFITYPTFTEQYYFHFQSAEIAFGLWISMLSTGLFYLFVRYRRLSCFLVTLPIYILTFSIYQSFIPLTLCCYLGIFLSLSMREDTESSTIKRGIWGSILHFILAFVTSQAIDRIYFASSEYLNDQVIWSNAGSAWEAFKVVVSACLRMFTGQGLFYTTILLFAVIAAAITFLWYCLHRKTQKDLSDKPTKPVYQLILSVLSAIGIAATPFILTLLMGQNTSVRTQFTYPLAALWLLYFSIQTLFNQKPTVSFLRTATTVLFLAITLTQIYTVRFIWDAHSYVADYDRETAEDIMGILYDSYVVCDQAGTILWGYLQPESPYDEALLGSPSHLFHSVFNLEYRTEPQCYFSTIRVLGYMESMGHKFALPTNRTQFVSEYLMTREGLSAYPNEGCYFNGEEGFTLNLGNLPE